jgi:hypothetical protein
MTDITMAFMELLRKHEVDIDSGPIMILYMSRHHWQLSPLIS